MRKFKVGDRVVRPAHFSQEIVAVGVNSYFTKNFNEPDQSKYCDSTIPFKDEVHWSIKPKEVTITLELFKKAWNKTQNVNSLIVPDHYKNSLAEELGL